MKRKPSQRTPPHLTGDRSPEAKAQRAAHEQQVARALQQPQGLGFLFAGLRPKGQR